MLPQTFNKKTWQQERIVQEQIDKYLDGGKDFICDETIQKKLHSNQSPAPQRIKDIIAKSVSIETLAPDETAALLNVDDPALLDKMRKAALLIKKKVYDNRIVTFAPLYMGNFCVNDCAYCGFRVANKDAKRRILSLEEVKEETKALAGGIGHKRLIVVYGEHPLNDVDYIVDSIKTIYSVKVQAKKGEGCIRRVNVNAPPFAIEDLKKLKGVGIGTYQVFQETYHRATYASVHPKDTIKGNYRWRLYCMHRAFEAGIDDVGLGVLFGLYDWKFEVMGLLYHARELEEKFGIGPHTVSFPRLEPASNAPYLEQTKYKVSDENFKKLLLVLRLSIPYAGMILTARETAQMRKETIPLGVTQTDASTKIGIGSYSRKENAQKSDKQQFLLGDTRSLDDVVREYAQMGYITSFCTAGYRCGRTGKCIMELLKSGQEGKFCKINAVLTFREWLDDFASDETKKIAEPVIEKEISEIKEQVPELFPKFLETYQRVQKGERDLYF